MICKDCKTGIPYNYSFVEDGKILLENKDETKEVDYEIWVDDYYVYDKFGSLDIK